MWVEGKISYHVSVLDVCLQSLVEVRVVKVLFISFSDFKIGRNVCGTSFVDIVTLKRLVIMSTVDIY